MSINFSSAQIANTPGTFDAINSSLQAKSQPLQPNASSPIPNDSIQLEQTNQEPKKGIIQKTKDAFRSAKKFFTTLTGYTGATFKGAGQGFLAGSAVFTGASIINYVKKISVNSAAKNGITKALRNIPAKPLAVIAAAAVVAYNYWKASLDINQKRSEIDLRWKKTPINN